MTTRPNLRRRIPTALALVVVLAATHVGNARQETPTDSPAPPAPHAGRVIRGAVNPYSFRPAERGVRVDASTVDLKQVFEDLGPDAIEWYQHVQTLSNPWFEGRAPGSPGHERAVEYIEWWMRKIGLEPAFVDAGSGSTEQTFRQSFSLRGREPKVESAELRLGDRELMRGRDFAVMAVSGTNAVAGPLVFAGYGIKEGPEGYTSFGDPDVVRGRVALLLRYEPLDDEGNSRWGGRRFSSHSAIADKLATLSELGAVGVLLVNPPGAKAGRSGLEDLRSSRWGGKLSIPVVQITPETADAILATGDPKGRSLAELREACDRGEQPSFALGDAAPVTLAVRLGDGSVSAANVGGVLRGRGALADEWLVVGGHFDHVGYGDFGADPANRGRLHPGADDNASGTAAIMLLARRFSEAYAAAPDDQPRRSVLFLAFSAEESGLEGSRHFMKNSPIGAESINAMINLDMIGRLRSDELTVGGVGSAVDFEARLLPAIEASGLVVRADPSGRGPSDHASFYGSGIPVLFFFTGTHESYHKPGDTGHTVNPAGAIKVVNLIEAIASDLAADPQRLVFSSTESGPTPDRGYAPVRLGVMPAMGESDEPGVKVESVSAETSAAEAGIKAGDVLLLWNGAEINGAGEMMAKMREHKPGDRIEIVLRRDGAERTVEVVLKESRPRE